MADLTKKLDLHLLTCLRALVTHSHVTQAAQEMGLTQPAMSAVLSRLRVIFQDPLLVRTSNGMQATDNAVAILANVRQAIDLVQASVTLTQTFDPGSADVTFRLSATESVGFLLMPRLTRVLERLAPRVCLVMAQSEPGRLREQLEEGEADLVVAFLPKASPGLYASSLYEQPLKVVASREHPRIRGAITTEEYLDSGHVYYRPRNGHSTIELQVDQAFASARRTRRIAVVVPSALASPAIAASSSLLATVTQAVAEHAARANDLQVLDPPLDVGRVQVSMFWHQRTHQAAAHLWLRQVIRGLFE